jgi:hypothetical protein
VAEFLKEQLEPAHAARIRAGLTFGHLTTADAKAWAGLKLPARNRMAAACRHLLDTGTLQRSDIMRLGEVSKPQASLDIRLIIERAPELMTYDKVARCYRLAEPATAD